MVECGRCETDVGEFLIYYRRGLLCTLFAGEGSGQLRMRMEQIWRGSGTDSATD
jgi:hypothetical protein